MNKLLSLFFFLFISTNLFAQNVFAPDLERDKCLEQQKSTGLGSIECEVARFQAWSNALDKLYDQVMQKISPEQQKLLIDQQVAWAKYRETTFTFNEQFYGNKGTIWLAAIATFKGDMVKKRYEELLAYSQMFQGQKDWKIIVKLK